MNKKVLLYGFLALIAAFVIYAAFAKKSSTTSTTDPSKQKGGILDIISNIFRL